ncbi:MAG: pimeloyl-ACP methyl ester carboxylesterase [Planctomycetota bacterium]|jgi:pimeloyl-ACP methyl ester carboxylesterase
MIQRLVIALSLLVALSVVPASALPQDAAGSLVDAFIDSRFEAEAGATNQLLEALADQGIDSPEKIEAALRDRRTAYDDLKELRGKYTKLPVECYHVDYASEFILYVPKNYSSRKTYSLVVVGHGGNSSMDAGRAMSTAQQYINLYAPGVCKGLDALVIAPASERGWGSIGYSLIFSSIAAVKRMAPIDPDRIYLTGQSMGGHLAYRMALLFPDTFGAVSPHSGGYNFVEKGSIALLKNVPGRSIFGKREPYGINGDNKANEVWAKEHDLDWTFIEKNGGHEIYRDELPNMARFFGKHPRDLYRDEVYLRHGGAMLFTKPWEIKGWPEHTVLSSTRPLRWNRKHWVEVTPREDSKDAQEILAVNGGGNRITVTSNGVREFTLYFHPKMVDLLKPISVTVNGEEAHSAVLTVNPTIMLDDARRYDDRGRVYWAKLTLRVESDAEVKLGKHRTKRR